MMDNNYEMLSNPFVFEGRGILSLFFVEVSFVSKRMLMEWCMINSFRTFDLSAAKSREKKENYGVY